MELTRLKGRLRTAQRGHKLLKDKRDELMKQFMEVVREDLALRQKVEQSLARAYGSFTVASALMSPEMLEQALLCPKQSVSLETGTENVMSVEVPRYEFKLASEDGGNIYPYGFAQTSGELDDAVRELGDILPDLLRLAEVEKATQLLAAEIERTRRRVNALEYVKIPPGYGHMVQAHALTMQQLIKLQGIGFHLLIIRACSAVNIAAAAHQVSTCVDQTRIT